MSLRICKHALHIARKYRAVSMGPRTMVFRIHGYPPKSSQNPKINYFPYFSNDFLGDIGKFEVPRPRRIDPDRFCSISSKFSPFYIDFDFFQKKMSIFFSFPKITRIHCLPGRLRPFVKDRSRLALFETGLNSFFHWNLTPFVTKQWSDILSFFAPLR